MLCFIEFFMLSDKQRLVVTTDTIQHGPGIPSPSNTTLNCVTLEFIFFAQVLLQEPASICFIALSSSKQWQFATEYDALRPHDSFASFTVLF